MAGTSNPFVIEVNSAGLTTTSPTYSINDQLGTEITCAVGGGAGAKGVITSLTLIDYAKVLGATEARFFRDTTTEASDNAAAAWSDADADKLIPGGIVSLGAPFQDANNGTIAVSNLWVGPFAVGADASTIYLDLITKSAHAVFGAVGDIHIKIGGFYFS